MLFILKLYLIFLIICILCIFLNKKLKSPALSPDLNPIEMVWNEMKQFVKRKNCKTQNEFEQAVFEFQSKLTPEKCKKYIDRLKNVCLYLKKLK